MAYSASKALADINPIEVNVIAEKHGIIKLSVFGRVYTNILAMPGDKECHVRVESENDVNNVGAQKREA
ncbi:hypothetical protein SGCOL_003180 [Colletotrichum sp. CLE4]